MTWTEFDAAALADVYRPPRPEDDKYRRGVVGFVTGSSAYPGAAVIGVEAALRTGVGMVRYLGPAHPATLVLQRRPEAVTAAGRVQSWVLGSGVDPGHDASAAPQLRDALAGPEPAVVDAGALRMAVGREAPTLLTPHAGELSRLLNDQGIEAERSDIERRPEYWAPFAAERLGATLLLKGHRTHIADAGGSRWTVNAPTAWLATAGSGDALAGILGALVAARAEEWAGEAGWLARVAAAGAVLHGAAAARAAGAGDGGVGGPITVLDLTAAIPAAVADVLR